jgi:hypothetical protein
VRREKDRVVTTNGVEGYFSLLKRGVVGTFHHVSEQHLPLYLAQFDHRHNTRFLTDGERTVIGLKKVVGKRLMYRQPAAWKKLQASGKPVDWLIKPRQKYQPIPREIERQRKSLARWFQNKMRLKRLRLKRQKRKRGNCRQCDAKAVYDPQRNKTLLYCSDCIRKADNLFAEITKHRNEMGLSQ